MDNPANIEERRQQILKILDRPDFISDSKSFELLRAIDPDWSKLIFVEENLPAPEKTKKQKAKLVEGKREKRRQPKINFEENQRLKETFQRVLGGITISRLSRSINNIEDVPRHKNLDCPNYDACLDFALRMDWSGFSCKKCKNFYQI